MDPQIINITKYLIKETPIGHLKQLLDSLKIIVGFETIEHPDVQKEILEYEEDHLKHLKLGDEKVILSKFNKDGTSYIDQTQGIKFEAVPNLDNVTRMSEVEKVSDTLKDLLSKKFGEYREKNFKREITAANGK